MRLKTEAFPRGTMMRAIRLLLLIYVALLAVIPAAALGQAPQNAVVYNAGWSLVAGPVGMDFSSADGPLYTLQSGDSAYETVVSLPVLEREAATPAGPRAGSGYWAYFDRPVTITVPRAFPPRRSGGAPGPAVFLVTAPAGQWVMIGNPFSVPVTVSGADALVGYDAVHGYAVGSVTPLPPGRGLFAYSSFGAAIAMCPDGETC